MALKELVARLYREQNKIQNLLSSLGFALRSFNNLNQFLELTPLMAARVTDADGGMLILVNGEVRLQQIHCQDSKICGKIRMIIEQVITEVNLEVSATANLSDKLATVDEKIKQSLEHQLQLFGTLVLVKNAEKGLLYVFSSNKSFSWTPTRKKLVQLVADQTAVAIANHDLTVELRAKERLDRELEIASEIQSRLLPRQCRPFIHCSTM